MNKIKLIKKIKANLIRCKIHKIFGFAENLLIFGGYMLKLSRWADKNRKILRYNDFYNLHVRHKDREDLYQFLLDEKKLRDKEINYLEFGVAEGNSLRWWSEHNSHSGSGFWGYDTYEGLPEKYGTYKAGKFSQGGEFPDIPDERIHFIKGLFQDTLLDTLTNIDFQKKTIVHFDADLYSSTLFSFTMLIPHMKKGDLVIFDEFSVPYHEFKAFDDITKSFYLNLEPLGAVNNYLQVIFEVK